MATSKQQTVVITGAGSGMGRAYALAYARRGARLALNDFDSAGLEHTRALLQAQGATQVLIEVFSVADRAAFADFAGMVIQRWGAPDVVINNAGIEGAVKPVWTTTEQDYRRIMDVNFYGVVNGTQVFLPAMRERGRGTIVNVSSIFGLEGTPNSADYCASKFSVRGFTEALMVELQSSPVKAMLVHPGGIATNIVKSSTAADFGQNYLTTPPEKIVAVVMRAIERGQARVVYGHGAAKTWLASWALPLRVRNWAIWRELSRVTDQSDYAAQSRPGPTAAQRDAA
jgi:NAD(P)-dependent dehydrogenase (short-subunit alcohol dehydrogenase family)